MQRRAIDPGQRGAAMAEALILLPFFFIVWGGLFFSLRLHEKKVVVNEIARTCAWERMTGGCSGPRSVRCEFSSGAQLTDDDLAGSRASLENLDVLLDLFQVDFSGRFGPAFRPMFGTERQARVARPRTLGGGEVGVETSFSEMCNELAGDDSVPGLASSSFCSITGWCN